MINLSLNHSVIIFIKILVSSLNVSCKSYCITTHKWNTIIVSFVLSHSLLTCICNNSKNLLQKAKNIPYAVTKYAVLPFFFYFGLCLSNIHAENSRLQRAENFWSFSVAQEKYLAMFKRISILIFCHDYET